MIKRTQWIFDAIDMFMKARADAKEEYVAAMRRIESARGSAFYTEEQKKAAEKRGAAVSEAAAVARKDIDDALESMRNYVREKPMPAVSEEQIRILQLLRLKESVSKAELDAAACSMAGHGVALGLLDEMAAANGIYGNYVSMAKGGLTGEAALAQINSVASACYRILNQKHNANSVRAGAAELHAKHWGGGKPVDYDSLPDQSRYANEAEFFNAVVSCGYDTFSATVDPAD